MATYRLSVYVAKRSEGRSATAMAAYRACEVVTDLRTGQQHDYTRKNGLLYSEIITPENAPDWARDRAELWNRSEAAHKVGKAVIAREIQLSLPHELDAVQRRELSTDFARYMSDSYGVAVDMCLHSPNKEGDQRNYHAHLLICTRTFDASKQHGLGNNVRELDPISHQKAGTENHVTQWRETWAQMLNQALDRANVRDGDGVTVEVDHRSYKEREIEQEPQIKEGAAATALKRRAQHSDRAEINEQIKMRNEERQIMAQQIDAPELLRRQAQQITERDAQEMGLKPTPEAPDPTERRAKDLTAPQIAQELKSSNDNAPQPETPAREYKQFKGENAEQFAARVERLEARAEREKERAKEQPKPELNLEPRGRSFGR
jgi:hypothetical protein